MYKKAAVLKVRFSHITGPIPAEDLYDLTLEQLNEMAIRVSRAYKESSEENFLGEATKASSILELKLDILKDVIAHKQERLKAATDRLAKKKQKERIMELIAKKGDEALEGKTSEELEKLLAELD